MSIPLRFLVHGAQPAEGSARSRDRSKSRAGTVIVSGWRTGFDKVGFTNLLRRSGLTLRAAHGVTNKLLDGEAVEIAVGIGGRSQLLRELETLKAIVS